jgi:hypothetical protein
MAGGLKIRRSVGQAENTARRRRRVHFLLLQTPRWNQSHPQHQPQPERAVPWLWPVKPVQADPATVRFLS